MISRYVDLLARLEGTRSAGVVLGLERTRAVLDRLGNPQRRAVTVQIAGTNGKGSTAAMTEAILRAAGLRTGLYTSPHLSRFTERIRVDGREADGDRLSELDQAIVATGIPLTYFEVATVLAFMMFAEAAVEVIVAETGLGGRLDATTACEPVATAITSIAWDHADVLGSTLAQIAAEKAGIAKPGVPLFLAPVPTEADAAIARIARLVGAPLLRMGPDFEGASASASGSGSGSAGSALGLAGAHQATNAALAVALARAVATATGRILRPAEITSGLHDVRWPGRLERVGSDVLLDCAHNLEGALALGDALDGMPRGHRALVFSTVSGKPAAEMLRALAPRFDAIFLTRSSNPRSLTPSELAALRDAQSPVAGPVAAVGDAAGALEAARLWVRARAVPRDDGVATPEPAAPGLVVVAGSTFLVGDLRALLLNEARDPLPTSDPVSVRPAPAETPISPTKPTNLMK